MRRLYVLTGLLTGKKYEVTITSLARDWHLPDTDIEKAVDLSVNDKVLVDYGHFSLERIQ